MKKSFRLIIARFLTVIFVLIILGPLAPLAMWSPTAPSMVTGECTGNCDTCGCSLERSATRTCCCWQKKLRLEEEEEEKSQNVRPCCISKKSIQKKIVSIKSHCPCERGKINAIFGSEAYPLIMSPIVETVPAYTEQRSIIHPQLRIKMTPAEPPDPPPRLTTYS